MGPPVAARRRLVAGAAFAAALALLLLPCYAPLLSTDRGPLVGDYGWIFLPRIPEQLDALRQGAPLLWARTIYGGSAYWSLPNTAPAYPPFLVLLLAAGPLGALNLSVVGHVLFGALGTSLLSRRLGAGRFAALVAGLLYGYGPVGRLIAFSLPFEAMAMAFVPWTLLALRRACRGERWLAPTLAASLALAAVPWVGGYVVLPYALVGAAAWIVVGSWRDPRRAACVLTTFGAGFLALAAGRALPLVHWTRLTNRAEPIPLEHITRDAMPLAQIGEWLVDEGWITLALGLVALAGLRRRTGAIGPAALFGLGLLLCSELPQELLYRYVPGFDRVRDPRRAWVLIQLSLPLLAALGLEAVAARLGPRLGSRTARVGAAWLLLAVLAYDVVLTPRIPPRPMVSLSERIAANEVHRELARRASSESRFRIHSAHDTLPILKRTAAPVTSSIGLEALEGVLGNITIHGYDRDFLVPSVRAPARVWGMLNCRYVTSGVPSEINGLELIGTFEEDADELSPRTDGPYLYRNTLALPRAALCERAVLLVDPEPETWAAALTSRAFDPKRTALVRASRGELTDELLGRTSAVVLPRSKAGPDLERRADAAGTRLLEAPHGLLGDGGHDELVLLFAAVHVAPPPAMRELADPVDGPNGQRLRLAGVDRPCWLVLAETYALYPGWTARVDGRPADLFVANGAATAVPLPAGAHEVVLEYWPPGLTPGLLVSTLALVLVLGAIARRQNWK